jgi:hypothetical protein
MTTYFAVKVYGAPIDPLIQTTIIMSVMSTMAAILCASYFWYKKTRHGITANMNGYFPGMSGNLMVASQEIGGNNLR